MTGLKEQTGSDSDQTGSDAPSYSVGAIVLCGFLACVAFSALACFCCENFSRFLRYGRFECQTRTPGQTTRQRHECLKMGYLPADLAGVTRADAARLGVPHIFYAEHSHDSTASGCGYGGGVSLPEAASGEISRDSHSGVETGGAWAEFLRRAVPGLQLGHGGVTATLNGAQGNYRHTSSPPEGS